MSSFLLRFEAIASRIASYSCPRGATGRVHALRLRRYFQANSRQRQYIALGEQSRETQEVEPRIELAPDKQDGYDNAVNKNLTMPSQGEEDHSTRGHDVRTMFGPFDRRHPSTEVRSRRHTTSRFWIKRIGTRKQEESELGDVLPLEFPENVESSGSPDEAVLYSALQTGNPHVVLKAVINLVQKDGYAYTGEFFKSMPRNTFSEMLRCLDPKHFLRRHQKLQMEFSPHYNKICGLPPIGNGGYYRFCTVFLSQVQGIMQARRREHPLSLVDFKYLLKCARAIGNGKLADGIWKTMTSARTSADATNIVPDAECFNLYLGTKCLRDLLNPFLRFRLRIIPDNFLPRSWENSPYTLVGHHVGPKQGIKTEVSRIFRSMVEAGISGNEESFCLMMIALGREGDTASVGSILKRVWGIDMETLLNTDDDKIPPPKSYTRDSPFYPSKSLLYTLAHIYGINNAIPTALRLVDYVSREYSVPIPLGTWNELLQWTYVLSIQRYGPQRENSSAGQLPLSAVSNLWATMTSEPYNVKPTMEMYNRLMSNLIQRERWGEAKQQMDDAYLVHKLAVRKFILLRSAASKNPGREQRSRDLTLAHLRVKRNREYIRRWVRLIIFHGSNSLKYDPRWSAQDLPKFFEKWGIFLPTRVEYTISTGWVRFSSGSRARVEESSLRLGKSNQFMRTSVEQESKPRRHAKWMWQRRKGARSEWTNIT